MRVKVILSLLPCNKMCDISKLVRRQMYRLISDFFEFYTTQMAKIESKEFQLLEFEDISQRKRHTTLARPRSDLRASCSTFPPQDILIKRRPARLGLR